MQVGSTCLGSFLGVNESEVHQLAEFATTLATMPNLFKNVDAKTKNSKKNNSYHGFSIEDTFASLFANVRIKKVKRQYRYHSSSVYLFQRSPVWMIEQIEKADRVMAQNLLKYFRTEYKNNHNGYRSIAVENMLVALHNDIIARRHYKFVFQAWVMYMNKFCDTLFPPVKVKETPALVPQRNEVSTVAIPAPVGTSDLATGYVIKGSYYGVEGQCKQFDLLTTVAYSKKSTSYGNGTYLVLKDVVGNEIVWNCPYFYKVGDKIKILKAVVIKHQEFKGNKQTIIGKVTFKKIWK